MLEFLEFEFMRKAIVAVLILSLGMAPLGCFLVLRRLSLAGEALSHAAIPGIAVAYSIAGLSVMSMTLGGLIAGLSGLALDPACPADVAARRREHGDALPFGAGRRNLFAVGARHSRQSRKLPVWQYSGTARQHAGPDWLHNDADAAGYGGHPASTGPAHR